MWQGGGSPGMRTRGTILLVAGLFGTAITVVAILLAVNAKSGFSGSTGAAPFGWVAPPLAASVIAGLAWVLLRQDSRANDAAAPESQPCPSCGRKVLGKWRLCPYCGMSLESDYVSGLDVSVSD